MKLEVGMYVRTKKGMAKIVKIFDKENEPYDEAKYRTDTFLEIYYDSEYIGDKDILKASHNIIDLIEVGDYVNGCEVVLKDFNNLNEECLECGIGDYIVCSYEVKDIESIVTKEQFENMQYRIGE